MAGKDERKKFVFQRPTYGALAGESASDLSGSRSRVAACLVGLKQFFGRHDVEIQLFFLLLAQGLRQFFYADALPGEMKDHKLISANTADNFAWVGAFVIPDVILRCVLVLLSRAPSIIHDNRAQPGDDHRVTARLVGDYVNGYNVNYEKLLADNKNFYRFSMGLGYIDAFFAIPSTMFFAEGCYGTFRTGAKADWEQALVAAVGFLIGVYGARSYISFRIPRSVGRMSLVLREIARHWRDSNINGCKLTKAIFRSIYVALVQGIFTFFSGYKMMERSVSLINAEESEAWQAAAMVIAVLCAFVCFHTNFYNSMTTELRNCSDKTSPFSSGSSSLSSSLTGDGGSIASCSDYEGDEEKEETLDACESGVAAPAVAPPSPPPFERQPTNLELPSNLGHAPVSEASKKVVRGFGMTSIVIDAVLTEMTCFFLVKFLKVDPDSSPVAFWSTFAGLAVFLFPNNVYTVKYTLGKAVDGLAAVFGLFCCGANAEPSDGNLQDGRRPATPGSLY